MNALHPEGSPYLSKALQDVAAERARQRLQEGWTNAHDDEHRDGSMALAAACYACNAATWAKRDVSLLDADYVRLATPGFRWPWAQKWWKPKSQRRDLVRAAALLIAEIERLDRVEGVPVAPAGHRALVEGGGTDEQVAAYERGEHDSMIREYDRTRGEQEDQRG